MLSQWAITSINQSINQSVKNLYRQRRMSQTIETECCFNVLRDYIIRNNNHRLIKWMQITVYKRMNECLCMSVPASINERLSSGNVAVQEGRDISITCSVFGIPQPEVTWYRRAGAGRLADSDNEQCQLATTGMERRPSQTNRASPRLCMKKF